MSVEYMSQEGYDKLVAELRQMESVDLPQVRDAIAEARDKGDLSENFEYHAAKREQARLLGRIRFKQRILANARVIDTSRLGADSVQLLSRVEMTNLTTNSRMTYTIASPHEADLRAGKISIKSPIAQALLNKKVGGTYTVKVFEGDEEKAAQMDRWQYNNGAWEYSAPENESRYVALINGSYFLKTDSAESTDKDMLHYDSSSKTYYIIKINEAASSSKLSKVNENRYAETRGLKVMEDFVNEICEIVAKGDEYKTLSTKHWLEEAVLKYHDTVVYDYFKQNYPELFE